LSICPFAVDAAAAGALSVKAEACSIGAAQNAAPTRAAKEIAVSLPLVIGYSFRARARLTLPADIDAPERIAT
jgi:hypothetical protein